MTDIPTITLNNGVQIPQLGFGTFQVPPDQTAHAVRTALDAGYRSIDTAAAYRNEPGVGEAIASSGLRRDELFVTTKLWNSDHGYDQALRALDASLDKLQLDYVDLYLIHWPQPANDDFVATWQAFEKITAAGRARAIGVSNFKAPHIRMLLEETGTVPAVNQIELHPNLTQPDMRAFHREHGIATEAWSPLAQGGVLSDPAVTGLAGKYGKTPAQVILRWHLQLGNIVIPKSVTPERIASNLDVFDFELAGDDVEVISELDTGTRIGPDPDTFNS
ncbi:MAG: aldo/keto reductase [Pseudonocardiaceae bacterium]|nr:aldo/keto reductase [Pseudonocardiaceae bacterium]